LDGLPTREKSESPHTRPNSELFKINKSGSVEPFIHVDTGTHPTAYRSSPGPSPNGVARPPIIIQSEHITPTIPSSTRHGFLKATGSTRGGGERSAGSGKHSAI
jgi:hypothetical protein